MASHLTVTTTTAGVSSSKALNASADATEGPVDVFAALLGAANAPANTETSKSSTASLDVNLGNLVNMSLGFGEEGTPEQDDPDAIAAVIDAVVPIQDRLDATPVLSDIVDTLADLKAKLEAGEPLDPETLKKLDAALADLAAALDIDLSALPSLDDLTALVNNIQPDDASLAARLTAAFGPVAENLFSGSASAEASAELSAQIKSVGDKLAALLAALNKGEADADQLAQLELDAKADLDLDAALAKLAQATKPAVDTDIATMPLAAPELQLTEKALTGKAGPTAPATDAPAADAAGETTETSDAPAPVQASARASDDATDRDSDRQDKLDTQRSPVAAAAIDKQPEPQNNTLPPQAAARAEVVAAPRVVQAGYQTSQQQLNLPQLAFEMVRQVNEGNSRFQIRLDPPELGRIDVRLDIDKAGQVHARLVVEKSETLDLMQRDQRALERALQQAGLDSGKTNLEFSLKQNPFSGQQRQDGGQGRGPIFGGDIVSGTDDTPPPTVNLYRGSLTASGVNIIA
ncbi:flagellar hook-length control protein FliK [Devosia oryziradicis]|uniref:Flagellar hook-length control protein FliK n=1 Tax=Devosia oryziradicis TaxID=2801335 RepID=A0ABX7C0F2_9HYPH|nr:flagellar hook-length control protein FliK [Devosia oryziradicis]QQR37247.1 flagellar hook-length control protein FliK [Devosia oryziradicis]